MFCIPVSNPPQKDVNSVNDTICLPGSCNESGVILQHPHLSIYDYNPHSLDIGDIRKAVVLWILFKSIPFPSRARDFQVHFIHTWVQHKKIRSSLFSLITNTFLFDDDENTISLEPKRIREWKMLCKKLGERRSMWGSLPHVGDHQATSVQVFLADPADCISLSSVSAGTHITFSLSLLARSSTS